MKSLIGCLCLALLLTACRGQGADSQLQVETDTAVQDETDTAGEAESATVNEDGLLVNPDPRPESGEFIVEGVITNYTVIPQDKPQFDVQAPSGTVYRIGAQPLSEIFYEDGSAVLPHTYRRGMKVRATVWQGDEIGGGIGVGLILSSRDFTILLDE